MRGFRCALLEQPFSLGAATRAQSPSAPPTIMQPAPLTHFRPVVSQATSGRLPIVEGHPRQTRGNVQIKVRYFARDPLRNAPAHSFQIAKARENYSLTHSCPNVGRYREATFSATSRC